MPDLPEPTLRELTALIDRFRDRWAHAFREDAPPTPLWRDSMVDPLPRSSDGGSATMDRMPPIIIWSAATPHITGCYWVGRDLSWRIAGSPDRGIQMRSIPGLWWAWADGS